MAKQSRCEDCMNYVYDEEYDCYTCQQGAELDEDEMAQFLRGDYPACPFYHPGEIICPNCGAKLEFDLSDLADAADEDKDEE